MSRNIPSVRKWRAHRPDSWNVGPPTLIVEAPTKLLARLVAAERYGIPILCHGAIRVGRIRKEAN